jgi:hypothetical protein
VNPRDRWGSTPLNYAKDPATLELLLAHGAEKGKSLEEFN